jgi:hypothetical protein
MADEDMDDIDFNLDDLGWPPAVTGSVGSSSSSGSASSGSGVGGWAGSVNIPVGSTGVSGQSGSIPGGAIGQSMGGGIAGSVSMKLALIMTTIKSDVCYVIVPDDGPCLELQEQKIITPREMIGIAKFINMVNCMVATDFALGVNWSNLVVNLGISKHFVPGKANMAEYDEDTDILYLFLFDD